MATRSEPGLSSAEFEAHRREVAMRLLVHCDRFMELDNQLNETIVKLSRTVADHIAEHPEILGEGLERRPPSVASGDRGLGAAADLTGGDWAAIREVIDYIREVLGSEKEFIKQIVSSIFNL